MVAARHLLPLLLVTSSPWSPCCPSTTEAFIFSPPSPITPGFLSPSYPAFWGIPVSSSLRPSQVDIERMTPPRAAPLRSTPVLDHPPAEEGVSRDQGDPLVFLAKEFEAIYNRALKGKPAQLKGLFSPGGVWEGLDVSETEGALSIQEAIDVIDQGRSFMIDPRLTVCNVTVNRAESKVHFEWILSGTWPLPYRPRVSAVGHWTLTVDPSSLTVSGEKSIKKIEERWDKPWWRCALEQATPKFWDLWHLYLTPPAERPLYRVLRRYPTFELREYYPRMVLQLETVDRRQDQPFTDLAWVMPDFGFTDELKLQGRAQYRETYVTTSPVEVAVESVQWAPEGEEAGPAKRITWRVPMPSQLGFDTEALSSFYEGRAMNVSMGEAARHVIEGRRVLAVRTFKGLSQTENYANARRLLLRFVQKEGLVTVKNEKNKSRVWVLQNNMKAGFNMDGHFCLAVYEQPAYTEMGEIGVQVDYDPSTDSDSDSDGGGFLG